MCNKLKQLKAYQILKQMGQTYLPYFGQFMKKNKQGLLIGFVLIVCLITFVFGHSHAVVGVVNLEQVREQAEPYQEIEREREKYTQVWRTKFRAEQDVLDAEDKKLAEAQKSKSMKKKAFQKALDDLQKKSLALQKKYQKEATKIMMATQSATEQIDTLATQILHEIAQDKGYDLVLSEHVLYASKTVDITDKLIDELNKMAVKINYPDPETLTPNDE